jgi:uncharacterized circularly permuted ATP-grasp superfamily protein
MLIGPKSTKKEQQNLLQKIKTTLEIISHNQWLIYLVPTISDDTIEGRHVDLRPYALYGDSIKIIPGALTRVA